MIRETLLLLTMTGCVSAQDLASPLIESFQPAQANDSDYQKGISAMDAHDWDEAVSHFDVVLDRKSSNADAALYWKAYALNHAGRAEEALTTIAQLRRTYPSSKWLKDAQAMEVELRAKSGDPVSPGSQPDEDLKLIAINSLMATDPTSALPILKKVLDSNNSEAVKDRALFILTQNNSPEGRRILIDVARGSRNRDLQVRAIRYLGMTGSDESRKDLDALYQSTPDAAVKHEILKAFMISQGRSFLLNAAKTEGDPELRREAIRDLGITGGQAELATLYSSTSSVEVKEEILKALFIGGDGTKLIEVARTEKQPVLRAAAIRSLGLMGNQGRSDDLIAIYQSDPNREVREAILNALFLQQNGKALVALARAEKDPAMKKKIVEKMALVHTRETTDYMMEVLK